MSSGSERWSGRLIWVCSVLLLIVVGRNAWQAHSHYERMRAVRCDEPIFNFGRATPGDEIDHTFLVINAGRAPLEISSVQADCGCTTVAESLEGKSILPQQTVEVPVKLKLAETDTGEIERKLLLAFAGEPRIRVTLRLKGSVEQ